MIETIIAGFIAFIGTNIDDVLINTLFFSEADTKGKVRSVVIGKYLGIGVLVLVSIFGAYGLGLVRERYIGFLGLVPIALGIKEIICALQRKNHAESAAVSEKASGLVWSVMLVTVANGADNIGVYMPLFTGYQFWQFGVIVCIFAVMIALWCFLGKRLSRLPFLHSALNKYKHIIMPAAYIALGIYIVLKNMN